MAALPSINHVTQTPFRALWPSPFSMWRKSQTSVWRGSSKR